MLCTGLSIPGYLHTQVNIPYRPGGNILFSHSSNKAPQNTGGGPWCLAEEEERERERDRVVMIKNSDEYYILNKLGILAY